MKLQKENLKKVENINETLYEYTCNDSLFVINFKKDGNENEIMVYKVGQDGLPIEPFTTSSNLEAWNKFEELLKECEPNQGSSGGFAQNPQENPNIVPLLAIKKTSDGYFCTLFVELEDKTQVKVYEFATSSASMPIPIPNEVFISDWSNEEVPMLLKCEIIFKKVDDNFEEDPSADVFLFIPKSITNQGGEKGGGEEGGGQEGGGEEGGQGKGKEKGNGQDKGDKGGQEKGDEDGQGQGEGKGEDGGQEKGDEGGQSQGKGKGEEGGDEDGQGKGQDQPIDETPRDNQGEGGIGGQSQLDNRTFAQLVNELSTATNVSPSTIVKVFDDETTGEAFLTSNNFSKIKKQLNLPSQMTAQQFTNQIINLI